MTRSLRSAAIGVLALSASAANADVVINELLGSTTGADSEFIELYNTGPGARDIGSWSIELWDSDSGGAFGGSDGASPYVIPAPTALAAGDYYLLANSVFSSHYGATADQLLPDNAIENSSYTVILKDAALNAVESVFVTDGGLSDAANDAGTPILPEFTVGPEGGFLPAGFYRVGDGGSRLALLEFSPQPAPSGTPGAMNVPEPSTFILLATAALALVAVARLKRRR